MKVRHQIATERITEPNRAYEELPAIEERDAALELMIDRIIAFGPVHLYRAVQQCIVSEQYDTAATSWSCSAIHVLRMLKPCCRALMRV